MPRCLLQFHSGSRCVVSALPCSCRYHERHSHYYVMLHCSQSPLMLVLVAARSSRAPSPRPSTEPSLPTKRIMRALTSGCASALPASMRHGLLEQAAGIGFCPECSVSIRRWGARIVFVYGHTVAMPSACRVWHAWELEHRHTRHVNQ